jgi:hypothetical protein
MSGAGQHTGLPGGLSRALGIILCWSRLKSSLDLLACRSVETPDGSSKFEHPVRECLQLGMHRCHCSADGCLMYMDMQAALVTEVPEEFGEDMAVLHPQDPPVPPDCMVFDLFRTWHLDSGSYEDMAEVRPCPGAKLYRLLQAMSLLRCRGIARLCIAV